MLKTIFAPAVIEVQKFECRPPTWKSGEVSSAAAWRPSVGSGVPPPVSMPTTFANTMPRTWLIVPRCVVMQPFERPVVPDV